MQLWKLYQKPMPSYCRRASLLINPVSCRELHWIRAERAAVLLRHQERTLLDRARERLQSRISLGCSGREHMRECQKIRGAGMTEGTTAALFQLGCSTKGQFPGHSQLPEEALTVPECKTGSRRQNAYSHQMKPRCVHYPEHGFLPLTVLRVPHYLMYSLPFVCRTA